MNRHKYPEQYMKRVYNKTYFEGWYYKHVDASQEHTISFIPSVSFFKTLKLAYVQVVYQSGKDILTDMVKFDISSFETVDKPFLVHVGENHFSDVGIDIHFNGSELSVFGKLNYSDLVRLKYSLLNPNIMGIFSYMPFMQCNHGILSMNHKIAGNLLINNKNICFDGGKGYIEKDWGSSFPEKYIWIQCNHFDDVNASFFFSCAHVPYLFKNFQGFICNFLLDDRQYRFATYTGAKVQVSSDGAEVNVIIRDRKYLLVIDARVEESIELLAPSNGEMSGRVNESLIAYLKIKFMDNVNNVLLYEGDSDNASVEVVGRFF